MTTTLQHIQSELIRWADLLRDHTTNDRATREDVAAEIGGEDGTGALIADIAETRKEQGGAMSPAVAEMSRYAAVELPKYYTSLRDHRAPGRSMRDWIAEEMTGKVGDGGMAAMIGDTLAAVPAKSEAEKPAPEPPKQRPNEPASRPQGQQGRRY